MKPSQIFHTLDLAQRARKNGDVFNPLFVGPPGIGKSQIVQQWCKQNNLPFIDLRIALMEAPDLIGFPTVEKVGDRQITCHNIPEFWPHKGEGVILLEEPNRGTTSVMNCLMQLLTDRKIHKYNLPEGYMIVGCINPEDAQYDVNTMDAALKDRFETFYVDYDKESFIKYMKAANWNKVLQMFVQAGMWEYKLPEQIGNISGAKYISPRTLSKLNAALEAGIDDDFEHIVYESILGRNVGASFYGFKNNEQPVLYSDIQQNLKAACNKLQKFSDPKNYKNGHISITISSIIEDGEITDDQLAAVVLSIPADQGPKLIRELEFKRNDKGLLTRLCEQNPDVKKLFKTVLKVQKTL